jgi:signal recognition particle receptor subunit beta
LILKIFIIGPGGILYSSKEFFGQIDADKEILSGFLTGISDFASEIKGGKIRTLNFRNFTVVYSYSLEFGLKFVIVIEKDDLVEEAKSQIKILKSEFIKRYGSILENWNENINVFKDFEDFIADNIYIPPKIIVTGERGVGKTTILNLIPGESILEIEDNLNEILLKKIDLIDLNIIKQCDVYEFDVENLVKNINIYGSLLNATDIVLFVSNSAGSNLGRITNYISKLKANNSNVQFYIIANFQDIEEVAFKPNEIEESLKIKTFGLIAIENESSLILKDILKGLLKDLEEKKIIYLK